MAEDFDTIIVGGDASSSQDEDTPKQAQSDGFVHIPRRYKIQIRKRSKRKRVKLYFKKPLQKRYQKH